MGYVKKVLIFEELARGYATGGKTLSGVLRAESFGQEGTAKLYLTNCAFPKEPKVQGLFRCGSFEKRFPLEATQNFSFGIGDADLSQGAECLLVLPTGQTYLPLAYATSRKMGDPAVLLARFGKRTVAPQKILTEEQREPLYDDLAVYDTFLEQTGDYYAPEETQKQEPPKRLPRGAYYYRVQAALEALFRTYLPYEPLMRRFDSSKWVKIAEPSAEGFCVVGLISEENVPRYLCYGVPARLPKPFFAAEADRICFLFQDAITGEAVLQPELEKKNGFG